MPPVRYLVQQPEALQNLALDKVATHICSFVVGNSKKLFLDMFDHHPVHAENLLNRKIDIMRNKLKSRLPWMYYDELADVVMRLLLLLLKDCNFNYHLSHKYIIGRTMEIFYTNRLTSLVFSNDPFGEYLQFLLYSRADYLTGLTHLKLISTATESDVMRLLTKFHALKSLVLTNVCTDNILYCIAKNCKLIECLKIDGHNSACSLGISDNSVNMLTKLLNLQNIELYNTSVTKFGVATLLLSCKNLKRVFVFNVDLIEPLEHIASASGYKETQFKLNFYRIIREITHEQLQFVFKMCPQIEDLTIKGYYIHNLGAIPDLKYLKALSLESYGFYEDQIQTLLEVTGRTLTKLNLYRIKQLDLNAVRWIYEMCPKMESLTLTFCSIVNQQVLQKKNVTQHISLEKISFTMNSYKFTQTEDPVVFLLSNCPNIKYIDLQLPARAINDVLLEVMNKSPRSLTELETLMIEGNLKEELLKRIVSNCINPIEIINTGYY